MDYKENNKIYELVGRFLLLYGNLEKTLDCSIELYIVNKLGNHEAGKLIKIVVDKLSNTKSKIEILKEFIDSSEMDDKSKSDWYSLINDLLTLNNLRNTFAHNMYGVEENKIIKFKKNWDEVPFNLDDLVENVHKLEERYRQLFDSVLEPDEIYISSYPKLKI